jgi:ketosteroid isomerase-like protein
LTQHPNERLLAEIYEIFGRGDLEGFLAKCRDDVTFTVPGNTSFSGVHTKATVPEWIGRVMQISQGTFGEKPVEIVANDYHGVVILDHWLERDGKRIEYRVDHIWEIEDGKITAWRERPGSEEEFNRAWA